MKYFISLTIVLACANLGVAQITEAAPVDQTSQGYTKDGYNLQLPLINTGAISTLTSENFNRGLISDPLLLLQGKLPSVQIYNRGGDPNQMSLLRIRGLASSDQNEGPLIVIDGIAGAALGNLEPNDIASVSVLKDASSQAIYGMRGSNGVILINTKTSTFSKDTLVLNYNGQFATSRLAVDNDVMTADQFRAAGGFDIGSSTDWLEAITRTGISNVHTLGATGRKGKLDYRLSGSYRSVEGILQNSGFTKYNFRLQLRRSFFKDKLNIRFQSAYANQTREIGFKEAFRYASDFNPTAPLDGANTILPFEEERYGGFYENLGLFESYNPLAIVSLNQRNGLAENLTSTLHLDYQIVSGWTINLRYTQQEAFSNKRTFYSPQSLYGGNAFFPVPGRQGAALLTDQSEDFSLSELYLNWNRDLGKSQISWTVGTSYHDGTYAERFLRLEGFTNEAQLDTKEIGERTAFANNAYFSRDTERGWSNLLFSAFSKTSLNVRNKVYLDATLRYDASSKLSSENNAGLFPALGLAIDFKEILQMKGITAFSLRAGYGITGSLPFRAGLSQENNEVTIRDGEVVDFREQWIPNENLSGEQKSEFNLGLDFGQGRLFGSIDWYSRQAKDLMESATTVFFYQQYVNSFTLKSNGLEIKLDAVLRESAAFQLTTGIALSTYHSEFEGLFYSRAVRTSPGGLSQDPFVVRENGQAIGTIYAPQFSGNVTASGFPIFEDVNGDGMLTVPSSSFDPTGDVINYGSGVPTIELGWNTQIRYQGWEMMAFFRGAFDHLLVNRRRQFLQPLPERLLVSNVLQIERSAPNLRFSTYSSLYIEKADFVALDNLTLAKTFALSSTKHSRQIRISLTGQNLLVITDYTGFNPEPALEDTGQDYFSNTLAFPLPNNPFAAGIDRWNTYLPSKTIVLGVGLGF